MLGGITVPPHPPPCQSHRVCCHDVPTGEAYRLSILPLPCLLPHFVSLYTSHKIYLCLSNYLIITLKIT